MREWQRQSHVKWYCRYHVVIVPKYRQKAIFGTLRKDIGRILRELCDQCGIELIEGHAMPDHVHLCLSIPPKYSVSNAIGRLKGKSAMRIHRDYLGRKRNFTGFHFWSKGYCVNTVGLDEAMIRKYIRNQEEADLRLGSAAAGGARSAVDSPTPRADRAPARGEKSAFEPAFRMLVLQLMIFQ